MVQQYREAQDELQEMRTLIEDQAGHLEGYRNKVSLARGWPGLAAVCDFTTSGRRWLNKGFMRTPQYLVARQQVEEQKRLIEQMETEHDRIADQVLAELHRVKVKQAASAKPRPSLEPGPAPSPL